MHDANTADPDASELTLFWRPACGFCSMLRQQLAGTDLVIDEVDIWAEPSAAAVVRRFAGGNETVPTLVIGDVDSDDAVGLVNPTAREVIAAIHAHAPHLLEPAGAGTPASEGD